MKPLFFISYVSAFLYASLRWEWVFYTAIGIFLLGVTLLIFLSIYRHFRVGGWF